MENEQVNSYRQTFMTDSGRRVLAHLLTEAGYFDSDMKTTEELAVLNYAKNIIKNMGICQTPDSVSEFINRILEISVLIKSSELSGEDKVGLINDIL